MCGFSGIVSSEGFEIKHLKNMNDLIRHRGPDGEGYLLVDETGGLLTASGPDTPNSVLSSEFENKPVSDIDRLQGRRFRIGFGHRRLSIIDLSAAGHQPLSYYNGRYWIVYNGEIYNYLTLREELMTLGHQFYSRSDTEVILAAYTEWGIDCLNRFAGMWSFVILDTALNELFIARDRYGIKPFYYWFSPEGCFCFGSEIKQFTASDGWRARLNHQASYDFLIYSFTDHTDETMFQDVFQLPPGCFIRQSISYLCPNASGRIESERWYNLRSSSYTGTFDDAAEEFRRLFHTSVKEHLISDVPVGTALSGGLDSSSIVCEINRILNLEGKSYRQRTFSSCAEDKKYDERSWMELVIDHTKVDAHFVYPGLEEVIDLTNDLIWYQDEPYQSQSAFLGYRVFNLASQNGVKVLLNGQGADEYLGGYEQFTVARYSAMLKKFRVMEMLLDIRNAYGRNRKAFLTIMPYILYHLSPWYVRKSLVSLRSSSDTVKSLVDHRILNPRSTHPYSRIPVKYRTVREISEHLTFYSTLPKYLRWEDRNSMANSVEARVPFLDHRLVEFCYNLPDDYLEKDGVTKRILREALKGILPVPVKERRDKMGFVTPEEKWVKNSNPEFFRTKIGDAVEITNKLIKPESIRYFDRMVAGKEPFDYTYWRLIIFSEWMQKFDIKI